MGFKKLFDKMNKKIIVIGLLIILFQTSVLPLSATEISKSYYLEKSEFDFLKVSKIYFNFGEQSQSIKLWDSETENPLTTPEFNIETGYNNPAAYIKGSRIIIKVKFVSDTISNAQIMATGTFGGFPAEEAIFQNGESDWVYFTSNEFAPSEIKNQSISWNWLFYNTSSANWDEFDMTSHTVYLLNKKPIVNKVWKKLADWTTTWCTGLSDDMDIADAILDGFVVDKYIHYGSKEQRFSVANILRKGNGSCGDLSNLFYSACGTQGVTTIKFVFSFIIQEIGSQNLWFYMIFKGKGLGVEQIPSFFEMNAKVVNNTYPYPKYYGPGSEEDDVDEYVFTAWGWNAHAVNLFVYNGVVYLYDLTFESKYENVFESVPRNLAKKSTRQVPLFRKNYLDKAVDYLDGRVCYRDEDGKIDKVKDLLIKTTIIPDRINNRDQIIFGFSRFDRSRDIGRIVSRSRFMNHPLFVYISEKFPILERLLSVF